MAISFFLFAVLAEILQAKSRCFCFSLFALCLSIAQKFKIQLMHLTPKALLIVLVYFLLIYKVKSCWLNKIVFPPFL